MVDADVAHCEHRDAGKRLIDFPKVDIIHAPPCLREEFLNRPDRSNSEILGLACMGGHADDLCNRLVTSIRGAALRAKDNCGRAIGN